MKKLITLFGICFVAQSAVAAPVMAPAQGRGRASMSSQMMAAPRQQNLNNLNNAQMDAQRGAVASKNQISAMATFTPDSAVSQMASVKVENINPTVSPEEMVSGAAKDMREKEKMACISNNIGVGNTFVWASRFSDTTSYATMVEDVENPENNICFVKVEMKSNDPKISVADVPAKYYEMGRVITCGAWANYDTLKQRILDAKKSARTWATIGGAVGGAGIGVGAMELFGNRLIGGKVMGQKALEGAELVRSQLAVLKKDSPSQYEKFMDALHQVKCACENEVWAHTDAENKPKACQNNEDLFVLDETDCKKK